MSWVQKITAENFEDSFHLKSILLNSIYYPQSGCDATDVECFAGPVCSFVHSDENATEEEVKAAMVSDFEPVGYDLLGLLKVNLAHFKFALWGVYSLRENARHYSDGKQKARAFSILHVCAPHKIGFTYLYEMNNIYPIGTFEKISL